MLMGQVLAIALAIIGFLLALQGLWLLCRAMWPRRVQRAAERCRRHGVFCFLLGLPVTAILVVAAMFLGGRFGTPGTIGAWLLGGLFLMYAGTGLSGFVTYLGDRLESPADIGRPWRGTVRGGIALELAYLLPIIGWFGLLPASVILGAGATTL